jgi:hypothetical protein
MTRFSFGIGLLLLVAFEAANVYFIMPMPGSQRLRSLELAYALHSWRWVCRGIGVALVVAGFASAWRGVAIRRVLVSVSVVAVCAIAYLFNFVMAADATFRPPTIVAMATPEANAVALDRLVVGVEVNGEARAYPLQFIGYHHQVRDSVGGRALLITYCTVCRTGRVFDPTVNGATERFRLVGMDQFNAMLEDRTTGSWWRQANGEAVTGPLKGTLLTELPSRQVTLRQWLVLHPASRVMQGDPAFSAEYAQDYAFERGSSRGRLTGTDPRSWEEKSWVVGLRVGEATRAYDWNQLLREGAINDTLGGRPVVLAVAGDSASFYAFVRPGADVRFAVDGDSLRAAGRAFAFNGKGPSGALDPLVASQEFWHSWRTFNPGTSRFEP